MIHARGESFDGHESVASVAVQPGAAGVTIPDAHFLFTAEFHRKGPDLVLTGEDGHRVLVPDYFRHEKQPDLVSPEGALLSASLVELLSGSVAPGQYAQAAGAPAAQQPIGRVETVSGSATVTRNGVAVDLNVGDLVFQGDVVQTRSDSTLGIGFSDGSAFSLKENARMALNEFVYDPNSTSNSALINLVQGTVSFIASQVAKTGNMQVETPTATLGIRGTFVTVDVSSVDGHTVASLGLETNLTTGEQFSGSFLLTNRITGNQVTVNSVNSMFSASPNGTIGESAKPLAMQAIEQASFHALSAIAAATAASMGTAPTGPTQFLNDPNSPSGPKGGDPASSSGPAPGGSSGANTAPTNTSPTDNHPTTITLTTTTTTDTHPNTTTATTVVQTTTTTTTDAHPNTTTATTVVQTTPQGPPTPPTVLTTATNTSTVPTTHTADTTPAAAPPPTITITSIGGDSVINNATAAGGFMISGVTVHQTLPTIAMAQVDGNGVINAANAHTGVTISGTESNADGQAITVKVLDSHNNVVDTLTTVASASNWSATLSSAQAQALADGSYTVQATVTDQNGNTSNTAQQSVTVRQTLPTIAMAQVDGNGIINATNAHTGVTISGTESNADGQIITVKVLDSLDNVVDTLTTVASGGSWSATLSSAQAQALADGSYTVQATVTDQYGNASNTASQNVTVEQQPTVSTPTISSNDQAGSNTVREGDVLTASAAGQSDDTITYAWYSSADGFKTAIGTGATYTVKEGDESFKIEVVATSTNDNGATTSATSAATAAVADITLAFTSAATITGTAKEGTPLTAVNGTLNDSDASVTGYQWQTSADGSIGWTDIAGATTSTYTPVEGDEGKFLHVVETAYDSDGGPAITSTSAATSAVADITLALSGVSISGTAQEGQTLTANGTVNDSDATIGYQWQSSSDGTHWSNIANATVATYVVQGGDEGSQIRVVETASDTDNSGFTTSVTSAATGAVIDMTPSITVSISGTPQADHTLTAVVSGFESDDTLTYQWQSSSDGGQTWSNITDATNASYQVQVGDDGHNLKIIVTDVADHNGGTATASAATYVSMSQEDDWTATNGGNWGTATNWNNGVPTSSVAAVIAISGSYTVTIDSSTAQADSLTVNDSQATVAVGSNELAITHALTVDGGTLSVSDGGTIHAGSIDLESGATLLGSGGTVSSSISNNGLIEAFSAHTLDISGNITGTGSIKVLNNTILELGGSVASTQTLSFAQGNGATGTLILDHASTQAFSAVIYNAGVNDTIDLKDLTFNGNTTYSTSFANGNTTLVVTNTAQCVSLTVAGNHPNWTLSNDGNGGTNAVDPPATDATTAPGSTSTSLAQTVTAALTTQDGTADQFTFQGDSHSSPLSGASTSTVSGGDPSVTNAATPDTTSSSSNNNQPTVTATTDGSAHTGLTSNVATNSQPATSDASANGTHTATPTQTAPASPAATAANGDTFVFAANFGNATISNFHPATDVIEIDHTVFANFQALLTATHDDGHGNAVITADPHDSITIKNVTVAQLAQHQGDFHFT